MSCYPQNFQHNNKNKIYIIILFYLSVKKASKFLLKSLLRNENYVTNVRLCFKKQAFMFTSPPLTFHYSLSPVRESANAEELHGNFVTFFATYKQLHTYIQGNKRSPLSHCIHFHLNYHVIELYSFREGGGGLQE